MDKENHLRRKKERKKERKRDNKEIDTKYKS